MLPRKESSACGVGFIASLNQTYSHEHLRRGLDALRCVEHRGACAADQVTGDGAGVMTDIPFDMLGYEKDTIAVATLFVPSNYEERRRALDIFEETFDFLGLQILEYRDVPVNPDVLGKEAYANLPHIMQAIIQRPHFCRTIESFDKLLFQAKQKVRLKHKEKGINRQFFFVSLSAKTIVYKGMMMSNALDQFYLDLNNPEFKTRFCLFHRRFSTNTSSTWDKAQPFRLIAHNGEINTIAGNRSWAVSREKSLGFQRDELLTHQEISDSGSMNEMIEALRYLSGMPHVEDDLALLIPPADQDNEFYKFWSRAMEPWDGPAFVTYSEGQTIGARLDRNGFRPCRWATTDEHFFLSSEAGTFQLDESEINEKGTLHAGNGVVVHLDTGEVLFRDPSHSIEHYNAHFDTRLTPIKRTQDSKELRNNERSHEHHIERLPLFKYSQEDLKNMLYPMMSEGKEPIGSMGDTARLAVLSNEDRSFFDFFFQNFSQVTNPPLDFIREEMVTDLSVYLGKRPNIFEPKELLPPTPAYELKSPILDLGQMDYLYDLNEGKHPNVRISPVRFDMTFKRAHGKVGMTNKLEEIGNQAVQAAENGNSILILSDRNADYENPPIPSMLVLRRVVNALNENGLRLRSSIVVDTAEIKNTHHVGALIGYGATAVCPYMSLSLARYDDDKSINKIDPDDREKRLLKAFEKGLLKIMAKTGISVVRSYQSAKLFTPVGLGPKIIQKYFPGNTSPIGGWEMEHIVDDILRSTEAARPADEEDGEKKKFKPPRTYIYKEHNKGKKGEKHSMTNMQTKIIHDLVRNHEDPDAEAMGLYDEYLEVSKGQVPVTIRHLFDYKKKDSDEQLDLESIEPRENIIKRFGSGAMSFGAISAESQRDIFNAMREMGARSNSGEGGENPYYYEDGTRATAKQVASARFGVTAEYIMSGKEIQIKIAQGAKPGEGGQLMGVKVNADIARARHGNPGVDLISPPPLHDIYSIEDLKQLIYELKQLHPEGRVNVKLVAGANIGTIAVGVAKAGADVIHVSGGEGGTGAATLTSMKHAGLPWELGLIEVHRALIENKLRKNVILRTDGGLSTGRDLIVAALLGAEEYEFGKLMLIAEGCVMARICEKNTCPTGIATHNPKFKAKYKGQKEHVKRLMHFLAQDVRRKLAEMGYEKLQDIVGRSDLLITDENNRQWLKERNIDLSNFFELPLHDNSTREQLFQDKVGPLNDQIVNDVSDAIDKNEDFSSTYPIYTTDRAVLARLAGELAYRQHRHHMKHLKSKTKVAPYYSGTIDLEFNGSAGQGFGVFMVDGMKVRLNGEANDSVAKTMSGGFMVVTPPENAKYEPTRNVIIGNCGLYGATGGTLYVHGLAGDRFAVRNSGATSVVEGTGLHACEYMTNGKVVILGETSHNIGAGMTGGELYLFGDEPRSINQDYIVEEKITDEQYAALKDLIQDYYNHTGSSKAEYILKDWENSRELFHRYIPIAIKAMDEEEVATK